MIGKQPQNDPKTVRKWFKNGPKMVQKWSKKSQKLWKITKKSQKTPRMTSNRCLSGFKMFLGVIESSSRCTGVFLGRFSINFGRFEVVLVPLNHPKTCVLVIFHNFSLFLNHFWIILLPENEAGSATLQLQGGGRGVGRGRKKWKSPKNVKNIPKQP